MDRIKLLVFMDSLRYERNLNQKDYLADVVSQRQYYRYLKGESEPNFEIITLLSEKLSLPIDRLINKFESEVLNHKKLVKEYFNLVLNKNFEKSRELFLKLSKIHRLDNTSNLFLKTGKCLSDYYQKAITKLQLVNRLKSASNYEALLKNEFLHDIELYLLGLLMEYSKVDREKILDRILNLLKKSKLFTGGHRLYNAQVYFWMLKNLGRLGKFELLIETSEKALEYSKKEFNLYLLEFIYYYRALAEYKLGYQADFEVSLFNSIHLVMVLDRHKQLYFHDMIVKDFGFNMNNFYVNMLSKMNIKQ